MDDTASGMRRAERYAREGGSLDGFRRLSSASGGRKRQARGNRDGSGSASLRRQPGIDAGSRGDDDVPGDRESPGHGRDRGPADNQAQGRRAAGRRERNGGRDYQHERLAQGDVERAGSRETDNPEINAGRLPQSREVEVI